MKKILVVDNDRILLELMTKLLEKEGHQVVTAIDGLNALDILKTYTPDVMFVDLVMPNINGKVLCRIIRNMPKLKDVYLIIISAISAEEWADISQLEANASIAKGPFKEMAQHVLYVLDQPDLASSRCLSGEILGIKGVYPRAITEELLSVKRHFEVILEKMSEGILEINIEGRIVYANRTALALIDIPEEKYMGAHFVDLFSGDDHQRVRSLMKITGDKPKTITEDAPVRLNKYQVTLSILPLDEDEFKSIIILHDVSERKRAEEILRESEEKLARSKRMEALGLLAGGTAHDLNNVLSGIVSYPELLLLDLPEDSKLRKPIETMQESGHRAVAIVQDLLTVARGVAITREPLKLNVIVRDFLFSPEFKKLKQFHPTVTFKTNLDTDLLNIRGSHVHIGKVVMNLISNASEAIEGKGNVIISSMNRYLDRPIRGYEDVKIGEYAVLSVSDDGSGISSNDLERIFEPFYTKKVMGRSGTGLGLAVVWNVIQDHEGYINVTSNENGTTFEGYFPITRDEVSGKDLSISIKDYKGDGETILVVDDVESQREIACNMLNTLGYKAKAVSSGEEAVEYLKEHTVDLILLDMIMDPGINGRETYERITKIHPNQKAIIVSGFAETDDVKEAQKLGAGQYIKKPFYLEKIGMAIKDELGK